VAALDCVVEVQSKSKMSPNKATKKREPSNPGTCGGGDCSRLRRQSRVECLLTKQKKKRCPSKTGNSFYRSRHRWRRRLLSTASSKSSKSRKCLQTKQRKKVTLTSQGPAVAAVALDFVVEVQSNITKRKKEKKGPYQTRDLFSIIVVVGSGSSCCFGYCCSCCC